MMRQNAEANSATKIFVNLPVKDLKKTMDFFSKLGFKFNPMFTDENAACLVMSEDIYAMLLVEKFFKNFIPDKEICDARSSAEALIALSTKTRQEVDEVIKKVLAAAALSTDRLRTTDGCTVALSKTLTAIFGRYFT